MELKSQYHCSGYHLAIGSKKTINDFYRGVILVLYRGDIEADCNPPSLVYTPGKFKSSQDAEIEAYAYAKELIAGSAISEILDD